MKQFFPRCQWLKYRLELRVQIGDAMFSFQARTLHRMVCQAFGPTAQKLFLSRRLTVDSISVFCAGRIAAQRHTRRS
jgi:hypothetical protein